MRCLVTGASGFVGQHLVRFLLDRGHEVHAAGRRPAVPGADPNVVRHAFDIRDAKAVADCLSRVSPDVVYHLAAQSYPSVSWRDPAETFSVNIVGSMHLFEALRRAAKPPRVIAACSSSEYADGTGPAPLREDAPLAPCSPYGVSKLALDHMARLYFENYSLPVVRVRPFFMIGPIKDKDVASDLARGVAAVERGTAKEVTVGNVDVVRDFMDIRDGVEAIALLAERGEAGGVYNVCTGGGHSVREMLDIMVSLAKAAIRVRADPARIRKLDEMVRIGDPSKLRALGWTPKRPFAETVRNVLDYWRSAG